LRSSKLRPTVGRCGGRFLTGSLAAERPVPEAGQGPTVDFGPGPGVDGKSGQGRPPIGDLGRNARHHAEYQGRSGQRQGHSEASGDSNRRLGAVARWYLVAGCFHRDPEGCLVGPAASEGHSGHSGGQVHRCRRHAGHRIEGIGHRADTAGAGHSLHWQVEYRPGLGGHDLRSWPLRRCGGPSCGSWILRLLTVPVPRRLGRLREPRPVPGLRRR